MTPLPKRIQRRRTAGWRMPEGAVYVGRGTPWAVFRGRAYAVEWPQPGELETVLGAELRQRHPTTPQASDE